MRSMHGVQRWWSHLVEAHELEALKVTAMGEAVRQAVKDIGYEQKGFHWAKAKFACHLHPQSAHIAQGVDRLDDVTS